MRNVNMSEGLRGTLPVELLTFISSLVRKADLAALASTSRRLNLIATPYLYADLDLFTYRSALACLMTLASSPATLAWPGRDLADYVQSLRLRPTCVQYNPVMLDDFEQLGRLLSVSVPRMVNLRELDCGPRGLKSVSQVLRALLTSPHPRLESIQLCFLPDSRSSASEATSLDLATHMCDLPRLQTITLFALSRLSLQDFVSLRILLNKSASQLRRLTVVTSTAMDFFELFDERQNSSLPLLEHLEIRDRDLDNPSCTAMTHIRSLAIRDDFDTPEEFETLPSTAYPALEELLCSHSQVPRFLFPDSASLRPIHTIGLDYTKYERNGGETTEAIPRWEHIHFAFEHFRFSAVPIRHLRFYVNRLLIDELQAAMSECPFLESLTMVVWHEPKRAALFALGERVFARLPRLHTFLLGDVVKKQYDHRDHFWFARDVDMQRALLVEFERHTSALGRVAFTTEFEWEKGDNGRWYTTEVVDAEVREEPDLDDEADSSSDSDMDSD
ncbi:hypothetical protein K466DRAFT_662851 [Polyporus arcularius HHB13444]|uniref:F-box domain-containing protein n=1 Tax=Polyporus arcularius HHB13444 TaxID=1314778 RepID=A0A5C3PF43_9APHY|nr:hypothetical protein K466DRAFT_662851 [Polyporus arcularius HHB13444]